MNISRMVAPVVGLALIFGASVPARADRIDDLVTAQMTRQHIPAVSIAVLKNGKTVKTKGYGIANLELGTPATPGTVYQIGSVSKQFIAAAVVLLIQDGKLTLDDPVTKYFDDAPAAWKGITVRHLLTHTSGLVRDTPDWPQFAQERIFLPLGMTATRTTTNDDLVPRRAAGYVWIEDKYINGQNPAGVRPSGAFLSTVQDLARWDAALTTDRLFTAKQRDLLWTPVTINDGSTKPYGFGWEIAKVGDHRLIRHGGTMFGFRAEMSRYVDDGVTVVVLTNSALSLPEKIAGNIAASVIDGLQPKRHAARIPATELDALTGRYRMTSGELVIERHGDRLSVNAIRGPGRMEMALLTRESKTAFFDEDNPRSTYFFEPDAQGRMQFSMKTEAGNVAVQAARADTGP